MGKKTFSLHFVCGGETRFLTFGFQLDCSWRGILCKSKISVGLFVDDSLNKNLYPEKG